MYNHIQGTGPCYKHCAIDHVYTVLERWIFACMMTSIYVCQCCARVIECRVLAYLCQSGQEALKRLCAVHVVAALGGLLRNWVWGSHFDENHTFSLHVNTYSVTACEYITLCLLQADSWNTLVIFPSTFSCCQTKDAGPGLGWDSNTCTTRSVSV